MLTFNVEQGTDEWHQARAGKVTASMFTEVRRKLKSGPNKGGYTKAATDYAFRLAVERETGRVLGADQFDTWAMKRGRALEPKARSLHSETIGQDIVEVGFACTDDERFGASADGLILSDGGSEYKCFEDPSKLRGLWLDNEIEDFMDQIQGCMWITGREWWQFCLYCPDMREQPLTIFHVDRDENYIDEMKDDLEEFDSFVELYRGQLASRPREIVFVNGNRREITL